MKIKTIKLDDETRGVFLRAKIDGNKLQLTEQLTPALYQKVKKAIAAAGGKWVKQGKVVTDGYHLFPDDVRKTLNIADDTVEVVNVQQTYQAFYTPAELAERLVEMAGVSTKLVFEPSCGDGALVRECFRQGAREVHAIEINEAISGKFWSEFDRKNTTLWNGDFLKLSPSSSNTYGRIVMNPPFTGGADVKHIKHALEFLRPGGRLVAICSASTKAEKELKPMAVSWEVIPAGAFKSSGTNVSTVMLAIDKE